MVGKRLAVLVLLLLSSGVSVVSSLILVQRMSLATVDFKWIYNGARCMIQRSDPYLGSDFLHVYLVEGGHLPPGVSAQDFQDRTRYTYPPSTFLFTVPF